MSVLGNNNQRWPTWAVAAVIFVVLIAIVQLVGRQQPQRLQQTFAASAVTDQASLPLPPVPTGLVNQARTAAARILGGQPAAPLTQQGENGVLRVRIDQIQREGEGLRLQGGVRNISGAPAEVSLDSFKFVDATGTTYASSGSPPATLQPGQEAPLDITLPVRDPTQLRLNVEQPGQPAIELVLINTEPTPQP